MQLYPFQKEGKEHLLMRPCMLLADDMGLGKTVQAVVAISSLFAAKSIRRVLILAPMSLIYNWRSELHKWAPELPVVLYQGADRYGMLYGAAPVLLGTYETVVSDLRKATLNGNNFVDIGVDLLVIDEAQLIKDPTTVRSRIICKILAGRRWALTGTPLENRPLELASILRFLYYNEFSESHELKNYTKILSLLELSMLRRTKAEVGLQLPPKTVTNISVCLTPDQAAEYEHKCISLRTAILKAPDINSATAQLLGGLQELRRIAAISINGDSSKIDFVDDEIDEIVASGEKVVIFSSFANKPLPLLVARLQRHKPLLFTGSLSKEDRQSVHEQFVQDSSRQVMCASIKAAGVGLTWSVACYAYEMDLWWNPQTMKQAEDRLHRIGQTVPVLIKRLVAANTIDEGIGELLQKKENIFDFVVEGKSPVTANVSSLESLLNLVGLKLQDVYSNDSV
ncbi:DEAD/DEAH box helicase [Thermodesulfobacteriota bacterium]